MFLDVTVCNLIIAEKAVLGMVAQSYNPSIGKTETDHEFRASQVPQRDSI